jgi:hypothetical protein
VHGTSSTIWTLPLFFLLFRSIWTNTSGCSNGLAYLALAVFALALVNYFGKHDLFTYGFAEGQSAFDPGWCAASFQAWP